MQECVEESRSRMYEKQSNEDSNYLHFGTFSESSQESIKEQLLNSLKDNSDGLNLTENNQNS